MRKNTKLYLSFLGNFIIFIKTAGCIARSYMTAQVKVKEKTSQASCEYTIIFSITSQLNSVLGMWQNTTNTNV